MCVCVCVCVCVLCVCVMCVCVMCVCVVCVLCMCVCVLCVCVLCVLCVCGVCVCVCVCVRATISYVALVPGQMGRGEQASQVTVKGVWQRAHSLDPHLHHWTPTSITVRFPQ